MSGVELRQNMQFFMFQRYEKSRQSFCAQPIQARPIPDCEGLFTL